MTTETKKPRTQGGRKSRQIGAKADRAAYWTYCKQTGFAAKARAKAQSVPCTIDAYFIDELLVEQRWRCAFSGMPFVAPGAPIGKKHRRDPFGPSLDRKVPSLGYVPGNVWIVCTIVNTAMNEWGQEALLRLFDAVLAHRASPHPDCAPASVLPQGEA